MVRVIIGFCEALKVDCLLVPEDLLEPVIFALSMHIRVLEETPEHMLRAVNHYLPHQKAEIVKPFMVRDGRDLTVAAVLRSLFYGRCPT